MESLAGLTSADAITRRGFDADDGDNDDDFCDCKFYGTLYHRWITIYESFYHVPSCIITGCALVMCGINIALRYTVTKIPSDRSIFAGYESQVFSLVP